MLPKMKARKVFADAVCGYSPQLSWQEAPWSGWCSWIERGYKSVFVSSCCIISKTSGPDFLN